jgi:hypothetical protein
MPNPPQASFLSRENVVRIIPQPSVLYGFKNVDGLYAVFALKVGYGAGHAQGPVKGTSRKAQLGGGYLKRFFRVIG